VPPLGACSTQEVMAFLQAMHKAEADGDTQVRGLQAVVARLDAPDGKDVRQRLLSAVCVPCAPRVVLSACVWLVVLWGHV
jgi:hypothetical protein